MKNLVLFLLLMSVGLNLGLGFKLARRDAGPVGDIPATAPDEFQRGPGNRSADGTRDGSFWRNMMERRLEHLTVRLDLTPEQATAFQDRHAAVAELVFAQRLQVHTARGRLQALIAGGAVNSDSVRVAINNISREQSRMDSLVTEAMLAEMEILDDAQRALYLENLPPNRGFGPGRHTGGGRNRRDR